MLPALSNPATADDILRYFTGWGLPDPQRDYIEFHRDRYVLLVDRVRRSALELGLQQPVVIDVAPLFQTPLLRSAVSSGVVHTVGFGVDASGWGPNHNGGHNEVYDLNDAYEPSTWPSLGPADIVVLGEIIEHLYISPQQVLRCVRSWCRPGAHVIVQTPNAIALPKRLKLAFGRQPYDLIAEDRKQAGHFRELTLPELTDAARLAGLTPLEARIENYFDVPARWHRMYRRSSRFMPRSWLEGITATFSA